MRLSSKLLIPSERIKKQGDWSHLFVLTVSENAYAFLSKLLRLAYFFSPLLFKVSETGQHTTA
jgi:hypothetical protein